MRPSRTRLPSLFLFAALPGFAGCDAGGDGTGDTGMVEDPCANDDRGDTYAVGLSKVGDNGIVELAFLDAAPAPPRKGDNRWVMAATYADDGTALEDATFTVTPFMPDHGHGTPVGVGVQKEPNPPGTWVFDPVNLMMAGLWEVTFDVATDRGQDSLVFRFCVDP